MLDAGHQQRNLFSSDVKAIVVNSRLTRNWGSQNTGRPKLLGVLFHGIYNLKPDFHHHIYFIFNTGCH